MINEFIYFSLKKPLSFNSIHSSTVSFAFGISGFSWKEDAEIASSLLASS